MSQATSLYSQDSGTGMIKNKECGKLKSFIEESNDFLLTIHIHRRVMLSAARLPWRIF